MTFKKKQKFLKTMDDQEIFDDVEEKKAIPELILKANIINSNDAMLLCERKITANFRRTKVMRRSDQIDLEGTIVLLHSYLKNMIIEKKEQKNFKESNEQDKIIEEYLAKLERGYSLDLDKLLLCKNYLLRYLHVLGITNLFVRQGKTWLQQIEDEY